MRIHEKWDDWVLYDEDGFRCGLRQDAPDDVKKAYSQFLAEQEAMKAAGYMQK